MKMALITAWAITVEDAAGIRAFNVRDGLAFGCPVALWSRDDPDWPVMGGQGLSVAVAEIPFRVTRVGAFGITLRAGQSTNDRL